MRVPQESELTGAAQGCKVSSQQTGSDSKGDTMGGDDKTALGSVIDPYRDDWFEAVRKGDIETLESLATTDVVAMPANEPTLEGWNAFANWWDEYFRFFKIERLIDTQREVVVAGDWAFEWGTFTVSLSPIDGTGRIDDEGRYLMVWKRQGARWKVSRYIANSTRLGTALPRFLARLGKR